MFWKKRTEPSYQEMMYSLLEERLSFFRDEVIAMQRRLDSVEDQIYKGRIPSELGDLREHIQHLNGHVANLYSAIGSGAPASLIAAMGEEFDTGEEEGEKAPPVEFDEDDMSLEQMLDSLVPLPELEDD